MIVFGFTGDTWIALHPVADGGQDGAQDGRDGLCIRAPELASTCVQNSGLWVECPDRTPPGISNIPAPITIESTSSTGATASYTNPTATDARDGPVAVSCTPPSGSTFPEGQTTVNCEASDAAGNTATATFTVTVIFNPPDTDHDGVIDSEDNCPTIANSDQKDTDRDGIG